MDYLLLDEKKYNFNTKFFLKKKKCDITKIEWWSIWKKYEK